MLIGDVLTDLKMSEGVKNPKTVLTIGYFNYEKGQEDGLLKEYVENFDIVLQYDQTLDIPNLILKAIAKV